MNPIPDCTGVLVAGGRARRLGGLAKGFLRVDGVSVAERSVSLLRELTGEVLVVTSDPEPWEPLGVRLVADVIPGKGAPGGLHAGLAAARTRWIFAVACDMPFLSEAPIRLLSGRREHAPAVVVEGRRGIEGLHAFWSRETLPVMERMLSQGDPSLQEIARAAGARVVPLRELREVDPEGRCLENVNTPEDVRRLGLDLPINTSRSAGA